MVNIGGFFANLKMQSDAQSFDQSIKLINTVDSSLLKTHKTFTSFVADTVKGFMAIGAAVLGASGVIANMQAKQLVSAQMANLNTEAYQNWSGAMKLLNTNSEDFLSGASNLQKTFDTITSNPDAYNELAKNLALIGVDISKIQGMSNNDRLFAILGAVEKLQGEKFRFGANIVGNILGNSAREALYSARNNPQLGTVAAAYNDANELRTVTTGQQQQAAQTAYSVNRLGYTAEQTFNSAITAMGAELRPIFDEFTNWLKAHGPEIIQVFKDVGKAVKDLIDAIKPFAQFVSNLIGSGIKGATQGLTASEYEASPQGIAAKFRIQSTLTTEKEFSKDIVTGETLKILANGLQAYTEYPQSDLQKIPSSIVFNGVNVSMTPESMKLAAGILHSEWMNLPPGDQAQKYAALIAALALANGKK